MRLLLPLLILACRVPPATVPDPSPTLTPPRLAQVSWGCLEDRETWRLEAVATSWTGAATLTLTRDGDHAEVHPVRSIAVDPDGSEDTLRVDLDVAADWRLASPGSRTAFLCTAPPDGVLTIADLDGVVTDCAWLGPGTAWRDLPDPPRCDDPFRP
jgi:hypothetical protein